MITTYQVRTRPRAAFTLIELMVSMALIIFIMVILTEAFVISSDAFRYLKAIGDMTEKLRSASIILRSDLAQNHFEGMRRSSDGASGISAFAAQPPNAGFIAIYQGNLSTSEGLDADQVPSARAVNHVLHMACRLKGNQDQSFYTSQIVDPVNYNSPNNNIQFFNLPTFYNMDPNLAPGLDADATRRGHFSNNPILPPGNANFPPVPGPYFYRSQWAELVYFLVPQGTSEEPLNPGGVGTPVFGLYRAEFVVVTDNTHVNNPQVNGTGYPYPGYIQNPNAPPQWMVNPNFLSMACNPTGPPPVGNNPSPSLYFFTPQDLAAGPMSRTYNPNNVANQFPNANNVPLLRNASLVASNVLSFQVQGIVQPTLPGPAYPQDMFYDSAGGFGSSFAVTQGSNQVIFNGVFNGVQVGMNMAGAGIPAGTTVTNVQLQPGPITVVFMNNPASSTAQNMPITFTRNIPLLGVSITIRVWDISTRQTRQSSIIQDL